jgi:hypothetical protein
MLSSCRGWSRDDRDIEKKIATERASSCAPAGLFNSLRTSRATRPSPCNGVTKRRIRYARYATTIRIPSLPPRHWSTHTRHEKRHSDPRRACPASASRHCGSEHLLRTCHSPPRLPATRLRALPSSRTGHQFGGIRRDNAEDGTATSAVRSVFAYLKASVMLTTATRSPWPWRSPPRGR